MGRRLGSGYARRLRGLKSIRMWYAWFAVPVVILIWVLIVLRRGRGRGDLAMRNYVRKHYE